jgi:hypothetical protein
MICITLQLACRQARPRVTRETTVCPLGYIHPPKLYEIGTNQQLPYDRNHNFVFEVAVLGVMLASVSIIGTCADRIMETAGDRQFKGTPHH